MKILIFDIETSPNIGYTWGKWEQNVVEFIEESYIMCVSYKWLDSKKIYSIAISDFKKDGKRKLVEKIHELFNEADIIIAHNGDEFDIKMSNREFARYNMKPPSPYSTIDTKKLAKGKFRFNSNKLDDLGEFLGVGRKISTGGFQLWIDCLHGDKKAWKRMICYNKQDVALLEKIYLKLRPWSKNHPFISIEDKKNCPVCGSVNIQKRGFHYSKSFLQQKYQCIDCGKWYHGNSKQRIISKENELKSI